MFINTNILSLNAQRNLSNTAKMYSKSLGRLSSGLRVNTAGDDAAGLAIATGLDSQRRGILQSLRNINDSKGFLSTTEGALQVQSGLVQRMRELAIQSANGTLSDTDRAYLNSEFQQLVAEFSRLSTQTEFNGTYLLDGNFGSKRLQIGSSKKETINLGIDSAVPSEIFTKSIGTGAFLSASTFTLFNEFHDLQLSDVNNDGYDDLIGIEDFGSVATTNIQLGFGDGLFTQGRTYALGQDIDSIRVGDFNGDGFQDILSFVYNPSSYNIAIQLGNGNGTFQEAISTRSEDIDPQGYVPGSNVDIADFNADGILDIAVAGTSASSLGIFLGYGDGRFRAPVTTSFSGASSGFKAADFNGDGRADIVEAHDGAFAAVYLSNGDGTFQNRTTFLVSGGTTYAVTAGDVNNDGNMDFVVSDGAVLANIYLGNGNGTFQTRLTFSFSLIGGMNVLRLGDFNGDSFLDLVAGSIGQAPIAIYMGNGNGTYKNSMTYSNYGASIALGDINNDEALDILTIDDDYASIQGLINTTQTASAVSDLTIASQEDAQNVLAILDNALTKLNRNRSTIGALQSRLSSIESVSTTLFENISSARSQILDADVATEVAEFSKSQILQAAGLSVLAQANTVTKVALDLLATVR